MDAKDDNQTGQTEMHRLVCNAHNPVSKYTQSTYTETNTSDPNEVNSISQSTGSVPLGKPKASSVGFTNRPAELVDGSNDPTCQSANPFVKNDPLSSGYEDEPTTPIAKRQGRISEFNFNIFFIPDDETLFCVKYY